MTVHKDGPRSDGGSLARRGGCRSRPPDGLQNEAFSIPTSAKIAFVDALTAAGLPVIEVTSFVNPKAVPQLADAAEVMTGIGAATARATRFSSRTNGVSSAREQGPTPLPCSRGDGGIRSSERRHIDRRHVRALPPVVADARRWHLDSGLRLGRVRLPLFRRRGGRAIAVAERLLELGCDESASPTRSGRRRQIL